MESLLESLQNLFFDLPILVSFVAGILSFLTPCILPLIPSYMSYIAGAGIDSRIKDSAITESNAKTSYQDTQNKTGTQPTTFHIFRCATLFVLGFSIVFFLLFLAMINVIQNFFNYTFIRYIAGTLIIIFGLHFLGIFRIHFFNKTKQLNLQKLEQNALLKNFAPLLIGIGFAAGWTPCTGPIVSSIGLLAAMNERLAIISSLAFILGLALPFLLLALFIQRGLNLIRRLKKQVKIIEMISGIFLVCVGVLVMLRWV